VVFNPDLPDQHSDYGFLSRKQHVQTPTFVKIPNPAKNLIGHQYHRSLFKLKNCLYFHTVSSIPAFMRQLSFLIVFQIFLTSCMETPSHYEYADGNGNRYIIGNATLEYIPVRPETSSSGVYSGGDPATVRITEEQYRMLADAMEGALNNAEIHEQYRAMMTGAITKMSSAATSTTIIRAGSGEKQVIEDLLKEILLPQNR
jgi:hypothetical protein